MTRIGKRLAAVFLTLAMVITFMPVLGTQTVYADDDITITDIPLTLTGYEYGNKVSDTVVSVDPDVGIEITKVEWSIQNTTGSSDALDDDAIFQCREYGVAVYYTIKEGYRRGWTPASSHQITNLTVNGKSLRTYDNYARFYIYLPGFESPCTEHVPGEWVGDDWNKHHRYCTVCGIHLEQEACSFEEKVIAEPTCTEDGSSGQVCTVCGNVKYGTEVVTPALGHDMGEWEITTFPTDMKYGERTRRCQRCDYYETDRVAPLQHTHTMTYYPEVPATTTSVGYIAYYYCSDCGLYYLDEAGTQQISEAETIIPMLPPGTITEIPLTLTGYAYGNKVSDTAYSIDPDVGIEITDVRWTMRDTMGSSEDLEPDSVFQCRTYAVRIYYTIKNGYTKGWTVGNYGAVNCIKVNGEQRNAYDIGPYFYVYLPEFESTCTEHIPGDWVMGNGTHYRFCTVCGVQVESESCKTFEHGVSQKATPEEDGWEGELCTVCGYNKTMSKIYRPKRYILSSETFEYDGSEKKPSVEIKDADGLVIAPSNYSISYSNNVNIGIATIAVTFVGDRYTGTKELSFAISPSKVAAPSGKTLTYTGKSQTGVAAGSDYTVSGNTGTNAGNYTATVKLKDPTHFEWSDRTTADKEVKWTISKAANPLTMKAKTATVKYSKLKKKTQTLAVTKVIKFTKDAKDKKTYTLSSAKKGKKSFKKYFKINKTTGKVTVKKGLKKGTYKVKVKVKAAGNANYKASALKTVTFTVKVK